ncbi:ankyrin repeat domain-containing protein 66-like [Physella acuta]|uniref:ankyrin repeat domain-containing protein 66-like n=1 Tax=Physella acuta TaxID=109671 RepID=UPI0027DDA1FF|nr:ankyrin repeat domain-containing protein 66-like [Physella acuta]
MDTSVATNLPPDKMTSMVGLEIHEAASVGDFDSLEELIKSGKFDVNTGDEDWNRKTPLHWACQRGFVECIRLLLDNGAKGTVRTETGWTPAHCAAETGKVTALRALHAANIRVDKKDNYGCTPRRLAEIYGHHECVKFLIQAEQEIEERRQALGLTDSTDEETEEDTTIQTSVEDDKIENIKQKTKNK